MSRLTKEAQRRQDARQAVNALVRNGTIPHPRDSFCFDCRGPATHYDHHRGYEGDARLDVQPVCVKCHAARGKERGELVGKAGRKPSMNVPRDAFARVVLRLRLERKWSLREMARRAGVTSGAALRFERMNPGRRYGSALRVATAFGISVGELLEVVAAEEGA